MISRLRPWSWLKHIRVYSLYMTVTMEQISCIKVLLLILRSISRCRYWHTSCSKIDSFKLNSRYWWAFESLNRTAFIINLWCSLISNFSFWSFKMFMYGCSFLKLWRLIILIRQLSGLWFETNFRFIGLLFLWNLRLNYFRLIVSFFLLFGGCS